MEVIYVIVVGDHLGEFDSVCAVCVGGGGWSSEQLTSNGVSKTFGWNHQLPSISKAIRHHVSDLLIRLITDSNSRTQVSSGH